mmetsp:Transcript_5934/g.19011  ORF Transcript_5934/g.19011 Transcript_5934/m.19011 type:complete len:218 (+) Transcript_5934:85-738(+)
MTASVKSPVDAAPPRSTVAQPSARAAAIALSTASAAGASPTCLISMAALSIMEAGLATPQPAMSGALPWAASKSAWLAPTFAEPRSPSEPTTPPARSDTMSPQQLGATSTSYACGWSTSPAQRESTSASSYRRPAAEAALRASSRKSPSDLSIDQSVSMASLRVTSGYRSHLTQCNPPFFAVHAASSERGAGGPEAKRCGGAGERLTACRRSPCGRP